MCISSLTYSQLTRSFSALVFFPSSCFHFLLLLFLFLSSFCFFVLQELANRREKLVHRKHQKALGKAQTMSKYKDHLESQGKAVVCAYLPCVQQSLCVYVCVHVCVFVRLSVCLPACMHVCVCVCVTKLCHVYSLTFQ